MTPRVHTVASLASEWGVSDTFVYNEIAAGRLRAFRLGGRLLRIRREAVEEYECRGIAGGSGSSPDAETTARPTGLGASSGPTPEERTDSRLARQIEPQRRPRLVTSGAGASSATLTR
jgi:excisionase family DNA binding protein